MLLLALPSPQRSLLLLAEGPGCFLDLSPLKPGAGGASTLAPYSC